MAVPLHHKGNRGSHAMTVRDVLPFVGYVIPTLVTAYGVVMPRHGIAGVNELTVGFASAVLGAALTYVLGLRAALARRAAPGDGSRWRRPEWIARQSARPRGIVGWVLGHIMRVETATANNLCVEMADIAPDADVLDVGCGPGYAVQHVGERLVTGRVVGLDASHAMVKLATRRNRRLIARGRAEIVEATANRVPYPPAHFDRILATHAVYFWSDLGAVARELRRVLKPGGVLVLAVGDPERMRPAFPASVYSLRSPDEIGRVLSAAGFTDKAVETCEVAGERLFLLRFRAAAPPGPSDEILPVANALPC